MVPLKLTESSILPKVTQMESDVVKCEHREFDSRAYYFSRYIILPLVVMKKVCGQQT